jgi:hypothetical protein
MASGCSIFTISFFTMMPIGNEIAIFISYTISTIFKGIISEFSHLWTSF